MFKKSPWYRALMFAALVVLPVPAFAAPTLYISSPSADGTFVLRGEQMTGVAGLDIRIGYDARTLSNPQVVLGSLVSGMLNATNPSNPIRMAIVGTSPITGSGSGVIATITFDRTGSAPGAVTSLIGSLIDGNQKKVAMAQPVITNPVVASEETQNNGQTGGTTAPQTGGSRTDDDELVVDTTNAARTSPLVLGGSVTMPGEEGQPVDNAQAATQTGEPEEQQQQLQRGEAPPVPQDERQPPETSAPKKVTPPKPIVSVVERFRVAEGAKSVESLTALFRKDPAASFTQIPSIGIADGKATVTLLIAMETGDRAPNFAFDAARYVSLHRTSEGWEIEARPDQGVVKASVRMLYNGLIQEFPLTVTPKAQLVSGTPRPVTEGDFQLFLKDRGTEAAPRYDLNKDGRRDYLDDYIFTANYLLQMERQAGKKKGAN